MSDSSSSTSTLPLRPRRKKGMEIHIPLFEREDRSGEGSFFVGAEIPIDQNINLADYVLLVLLGRDGGPGARLVLRPRDEGSLE